MTDQEYRLVEQCEGEIVDEGGHWSMEDVVRRLAVYLGDAEQARWLVAQYCSAQMFTDGKPDLETLIEQWDWPDKAGPARRRRGRSPQ